MQSFKNIYSGDACGHQADLDVQTLYSHQDFSNNLMSKFTSSIEIWGKKFSMVTSSSFMGRRGNDIGPFQYLRNGLNTSEKLWFFESSQDITPVYCIDQTFFSKPQNNVKNFESKKLLTFIWLTFLTASYVLPLFHYLFDIPFIIILDYQIFFVQLEIVPNNLEHPCKICIKFS